MEAGLQQEDLGVSKPYAGLAELGVAEARDNHLVIMLQVATDLDTNLILTCFPSSVDSPLYTLLTRNLREIGITCKASDDKPSHSVSVLAYHCNIRYSFEGNLNQITQL